MIASNSPAPSAIPIQTPTPVVANQTNQQNFFPIRTFKALGGVQLGLGILIGLLSIIGIVFDGIALHRDCGYNWYNWSCWRKREEARALFAFDITCVICSGWYILTGFLPLCMSRKRENSWKGLRVGFMVCSIIGAAIFVPTTFSLGVAGSVKRGIYDTRAVVLSAFIAVLSFAELIVAIISASYCCCCARWSTQQPVPVMYMNTTQPGMFISIPQTQIPMMTYQPMTTVGQQVNTTLQNPHAQQYHVITTNQPMTHQYQAVSTNQQGVSLHQTQIIQDDNPPAYKE